MVIGRWYWTRMGLTNTRRKQCLCGWTQQPRRRWNVTTIAKLTRIVDILPTIGHAYMAGKKKKILVIKTPCIDINSNKLTYLFSCKPGCCSLKDNPKQELEIISYDEIRGHYPQYSSCVDIGTKATLR